MTTLSPSSPPLRFDLPPELLPEDTGNGDEPANGGLVINPSGVQFQIHPRGKHDWEIVAPQRFSLVAFRRNGSDADNEALVERVNRRGEMFVSHTRLDGRYVLRLAIGNARTSEADVRRAWEILREEAGR